MLLLSFLPLVLPGQLQVGDNFSDGNIRQNPLWIGDTARFTVTPNKRLQLQDSLAGTAYLSTASRIAERASWQLTMELDFNPSGSNFSRYYLMSSQARLSGNLRGYYLQISGSSEDRISLYRQDGNGHTALLQTAANWADTDPVQVYARVTRNRQGWWQLRLDTGRRQTLLLIDSVQDLRHRASAYQGWYCQYTKTRSDKMFLDSIYSQGFAYQDSLPPRLDSFALKGVNRLELYFDEPLAPASVQDTGHYWLSPDLGQPVQAGVGPEGRQVALLWGDTLVNKQRYTLTLQNLRDTAGNAFADTLALRRVVAQPGDLLVHELMPDPAPVVGLPPNALPEREYLELYNASEVPLPLAGWQLVIREDTIPLPAYRLGPDSLVTVSDEDGQNEWPAGIKLLWADLSRFALLNEGARVSLISPEKRVIHTLFYTENWYDDPNKKEGGWSLEMIDPANTCGGDANWTACQDPLGGTPSRPNSVAGSRPDTIAPRLVRASLPRDSAVLIHFSEAIPSPSLTDPAAYAFRPSLPIRQIKTDPSRREALLHLAEGLEKDSLYQLYTRKPLRDCRGLPLQADTLLVGRPGQADSGLVFINELLFNPPPGGVDYLELYHAGPGVLDLSKLRIGRGAKGMPTDLVQPRPESYLWYPGEYLVLTTDTAALKRDFEAPHPETLVEVSDLPSWPNDEGTVALYTARLALVDHLAYEEDWHLPVLEETEGVSLERQSRALPTQNANNWTSAAATANFGTPGYENSQRFDTRFGMKLRAEPEVLSPNQDGYHDQTQISYQFPQPGYVVDLGVYAPSGALVRQLAEQVPVGQKGFFSWDGSSDEGQLVNRGNYIIVMRYYHPQGASGVEKTLCAVSR
jgi:hypothetical protein